MLEVTDMEDAPKARLSAQESNARLDGTTYGGEMRVVIWRSEPGEDLHGAGIVQGQRGSEE